MKRSEAMQLRNENFTIECGDRILINREALERLVRANTSRVGTRLKTITSNTEESRELRTWAI